MEKVKISLPIIVEGRYDKSALMGFLDANIITTGGFSIFNNKEKQALIRRIAERGIIVLTDSDGGGKQIRKFLCGIIPSDKIHNLYIPKIEGKESRKRKPSADGTLGVEGMDKETILRLWDSKPPAMTTSAQPDRIFHAAWLMESIAEPHCISTKDAEVSKGRPAAMVM